MEIEEIAKEVYGISKLDASDDLVWATDAEEWDKDDPVLPKEVRSKYSVDKAKAEKVVREVKAMHKDAEKQKKIPASQARAKEKLEKVAKVLDYEDNLQEMALEYLREHVRVQMVDQKQLLFIRNSRGQVDLHRIGPDFTRVTQLNAFIGSLREMDKAGEKEKEKLEYEKGIERFEAWRRDIITAIAAGKPVLEDAGRTKMPTFSTVIENAMNHILQYGEKVCIMQCDAPIFAWDREATCRLDSSWLVDGPTPTFDRFLARVSHPRTLQTFIWKLFDDTDCKGRQMVWGLSRGNAGQSSFWNAIYRAMQSVAVSMSKTSYGDKFSESKYYRKRLAIMGDCPDPHFCKSQLVKKLTGGDTGDIEKKGQDSFAGKLWCRLVVHANTCPEIDTSEQALMTRLLFFIVETIPEDTEDRTIDDKYDAEIWHFIYKCKQVHDEVCLHPDGTPRVRIPMPKEMFKDISVLCDTNERRIARKFVEDFVRLDENATTLESQLWEKYRAIASSVLNYNATVTQRQIDPKRRELVGVLGRLIEAKMKSKYGSNTMLHVEPFEGGVLQHRGYALLSVSETFSDDDDTMPANSRTVEVEQMEEEECSL